MVDYFVDRMPLAIYDELETQQEKADFILGACRGLVDLLLHDSPLEEIVDEERMFKMQLMQIYLNKQLLVRYMHDFKPTDNMIAKLQLPENDV